MDLKDGEIICKKCNGTGKCRLKTHPLASSIYTVCRHCNGSGKLDWIEQIVGSKPHRLDFIKRTDLYHHEINPPIVVFND